MTTKRERRIKIKYRVRNKISGTTECPRMSCLLYTSHFKKAGVTPKKHLAECKEFETELNLGDTVTVELFNDATFVDVVGTSKGKGCLLYTSRCV